MLVSNYLKRNYVKEHDLPARHTRSGAGGRFIRRMLRTYLSRKNSGQAVLSSIAIQTLTWLVHKIKKAELMRLNYLNITGIEVGLILNFKPAKLEWERLVLETARN